MYSVVLMAALTTGVAAPDCHHRCGCCGGCYGCYGGCYGCCGGGCYGCCGGCFGGWGCCGGGCYGGCYGCWGGYSGWGCGGCIGAGCVGGVVGGGVGYPGGVYSGGVMGGTVAPAAPQQPEQAAPPKPSTNNNNQTNLSTSRAKLVVELPEDAKLFIDDVPMKTKSGKRSFKTPTLEAGQAYYYIVRIEYVRDGKTVSQTRRVIVRAGMTARAEFKTLNRDDVRTASAK